MAQRNTPALQRVGHNRLVVKANSSADAAHLALGSIRGTIRSEGRDRAALGEFVRDPGV